MLGLSLLEPNRALVEAAVSAVYQAIHPYQDHRDSKTAVRALELQRILGGVSSTISDDDKWRVYDEQVITSLEEEYARSNGSDSRAWKREEFLRWLSADKNVHPQRVEDLADDFLGAAEEPVEQSETGLSLLDEADEDSELEPLPLDEEEIRQLLGDVEEPATEPETDFPERVDGNETPPLLMSRPPVVDASQFLATRRKRSSNSLYIAGGILLSIVLVMVLVGAYLGGGRSDDGNNESVASLDSQSSPSPEEILAEEAEKKAEEERNAREKVEEEKVVKDKAEEAAAMQRFTTLGRHEMGGPVVNSIGMVLEPIAAGEFLMGSPDSGSNSGKGEKPQHLVKITKPFYLSAHEVTQQQYEKAMGVRPWEGKGRVQEGPDYPATYVSWNDAVKFCQTLTEQEGVEYRLPTEAEWEYACRAGTTTDYSFGDDASKLGEYAWYGKNSRKNGRSRAHRVGQKLPNPWGLFDMHGNVWEWCHDRHGPYTRGQAVDPTGPSQGTRRLLRGVAYGTAASKIRSAIRFNAPPTQQTFYIGFRPVRTYAPADVVRKPTDSGLEEFVVRKTSSNPFIVRDPASLLGMLPIAIFAVVVACFIIVVLVLSR